MTRAVDRLAQQLQSRQQVRFLVGTTVGAVSSQRVQVDVGDRVVTATVPGSIRVLPSGSNVRVVEQGNTRSVDSILDELEAPEVDAPPGTASANSTSSSGAYDWTDGTQMGTYARDIAAVTRNLAGDINELRGDVQDLVSAVNDLRSTVAGLRSALQDQGHIT